MSKNLRKKFLLTIIFISILILAKNEVKAILQSNANEGTTDNVNNWMINIRKMEETGGSIGLFETIKEDLTNEGNPNNIDIHMQKNTEYGAVAILSASNYGNPNKIEDGDTTTGNISGVVMKLNTEWVAGGGSLSGGYNHERHYPRATNYYNARPRYKNLQTSGYTEQGGDAVAETYGWHGGSGAWGQALSVGYDMYTSIVRANGGSIFSYYSYVGWEWAPWSTKRPSDTISTWPQAHYTRAVIVSGEGF